MALSPAATGLRSRHKVLGQLPTYWWLIMATPPPLQGRYSSIFAKRVVRIAIQPPLGGLRRSDDRMPGGVRVFAGVTVRRAITTKCHSALLTGAKMHPG